MKFFIWLLSSLVVFSVHANQDWIGNYSFYESADPEHIQAWDYSLTVNRGGGDNLISHLEINGHMTAISLDGKVAIDGNQATFLFLRYNGVNLSRDFHPGDKLFILERKGNVLLTHWKMLRPVLQSNENSGVHFRIKDGM
ncbi:DUF5991 domain-containing protein [Aeromonas hydrophila]|uniref:DUF5991 domain-containing protein n=1 Tax=Aeromonas hydrophila TaxID=644 RepID=UPI0013E08DBB|nr:DUF5991 domain-containing protein [Aeromonas hydrophila]MCP3244963.1 DUF5991 domain-containing protein [Aeromonas hydrophila]BCO15962.1 hypothetical protein RIMD111065_43180 [Aeromonas hydrophila]HAU4896579.1 hypothetical protein [Aeromonas hydrophila]